MEYRGSSGVYILQDQPMKAGGEGAIHLVQNHEDMVAKVYHPEKLSRELEEKITFMTNNPPERSILNQIAWPLDVIRDASGRFVGFVMPKLSIDTDLKSIYSYPPNPKIPITYEQKVIVAINICIVISAIHKAGYVFGDFNPLNIGINLKTGHVAFLDTDSYHITDTSGKVYRCEVCLDGYVAPELIQKCKGTDFASAPLPTFTQETDRFALAIHIFKLLMNGYTPFNGIKEGESASQASPGVGNLAIERDNYCFKPGNKPQSVATPDLSAFSPDIQFLFKKTFLGGVSAPQQRATADEWFHALKEYKDNLTQCSKDPNHYYYVSASSCPYCDADSKYSQSMANASSTYKANSQKQPGQMSFSAPISIPSFGGAATATNQSSQLTNLVNQYKNNSILKIILWIFFFPIMLSYTIWKSKRFGTGAKIGLTFLILCISLSTCGNTMLSLIGGSGSGTSASGGVKTITLEGKYKLTPNDTGYTIEAIDSKQIGLIGPVRIPSEYEGVPITAIAEEGFANCTGIVSVTVPDTVTSIGFGAFKGCTGIKDITLPFIGQSANAENEKAVLGYIFGYEYEKKDGGNNSFTLVNDRPVDRIGQTWQLTYQKNWNTYYFYYNIPESLTEVTVTSQKYVPPYAFNGCKNFTKITYSSLTGNIGEGAFQDCENLQFGGENGGYLEIANGATSVGAYAYSGCVNITDVFVPDTVREIGDGAFKGCTNLKSLKVPFVGKSEDAENEESVLGYIFGCERIEKDGGSNGFTLVNDRPVERVGQTWQLTYQMHWNTYYFYYNIPDSLTSVTITKQTSIPAYAFNGCKNIATIEYLTKPTTDITIGDGAFQGCENLEFNGNDKGYLEIDSRVITIGEYAYSGCKKLTEVVIPNTTRTIGTGAFKDCSNLNSVSLPFVGNTEDAENEKAVLGYIFGYECVEKDGESNSFVLLNDRPVERVGQTWQLTYQKNWNTYYFYYNIPNSLTKVTITKQTSIPAYAFNGCKNLTEINLMPGTTNGEYAFQNCPAAIIKN